MRDQFLRSARRSWRTLLLTTLAALGLGPCVDAQEGANAGAVSRAAIEEALRQLDAALAADDVAGYLDAFEPDHPGTHAVLGHRLRDLTASSHALRRSSTIVGQARRVGPRTVVRVRAELSIGDTDTKVPLEDTIYAFRAEDGHAIPTFAVGTPRSTDCPAQGVFACPPCNYSIGGVPGWFCVPMCRDRAQAVEASAFYFAGTDLACDVSVRVTPATPDDEAHGAIAIAEQLTAVLRQYEPNARAGLATQWVPPAHERDEIEGLEGARVEVEIPAGSDDARDVIARFHVLRFGDLQHLLLVRGSKAAVREHMGQLTALLRSFRLLDLDADRANAGARSLRHHIGGEFVGAAYHNTRHDVRMTGPDDWKTQQLCGGSAFCARWSSAGGSRLWLHAYTVPAGMNGWCEVTARRWLREVCEQTQLELPTEPGAWKVTDDGRARALTARCQQRIATPAMRERRLLVAFRSDLLVVADGAGASDADWQAIERAFATLRL